MADFYAMAESYLCAEQYMMASKAELFGDQAIQEQSFSYNDPKSKKAVLPPLSPKDKYSAPLLLKELRPALEPHVTLEAPPWGRLSQKVLLVDHQRKFQIIAVQEHPV